MSITRERITNIELGGVDPRDYPDFCDAFVEDCDIDGRKATEAELDEIANDYELTGEIVQELAFDSLIP